MLLLEEAVLRKGSSNWCVLELPASEAGLAHTHAVTRRLILAQGIAPPQIVMGISAKPHRVVNLAKARRRRLPALRRFTGGGTVVVDHNTLFVSLIMNAVSAGTRHACPVPSHIRLALLPG